VAVRRLLLAGNKPLQIKASALSNGFWHLGEFAALYAAQFGEAPSITLARAQQRL
jgi:transcriptional regulator GlxA family with amidase domain